jgi:hypothetical protein
MPDLAGQQSDLSAMVGVVRNKITQKSCDIGTKTFDAAIAIQRAADHNRERVPALFQGTKSLRRRHSRAIERLGDFAPLVGSLQPHNANIVHVGDDRRNGTALAAMGRSIPSLHREIVDEILIDAVVGIECIQERDRKLARERPVRIHRDRRIRGLGHDLGPGAETDTWQVFQISHIAMLRARAFYRHPVNRTL